MQKSGICVDIPGRGPLLLKHLISDYTGTLAYRGVLVAGVQAQLQTLGEQLDIYVLSADTRGTAKQELDGLPLELHILQGNDHDCQKRDFAKQQFDLRHVVALGNGSNDRLLLKAVKEAGGLAVAVDNGEGCSCDAQMNADIFVFGAANALELVIDTSFVKATLRF